MRKGNRYDTGRKDDMGRPIYEWNKNSNKTVSNDNDFHDLKSDFDDQPDLDDWGDDYQEEESLDDLLSEFDDYDNLDIDNDDEFGDFSEDYDLDDLDNDYSRDELPELGNNYDNEKYYW